MMQMKKITQPLGVAILLASSGVSVNAANLPTKMQPSVYVPKTVVTATSPELVQVGYSFGYLMGETNKDSIDDLNLDGFFQGFRDAYLAQSPTLDKKRMQQVLLDYQI